MVMYPSSAVRFVYLPKMNAFRSSDELDGVVVVVPLFSDSTIGTAVASKSIHTNIPTILFFIMVFPFLRTDEIRSVLSDGFLFKCLKTIKIQTWFCID